MATLFRRSLARGDLNGQQGVVFGGTGQAEWDAEKVAAFKQTEMDFLLRHFPEGQLHYANPRYQCGDYPSESLISTISMDNRRKRRRH